MAVTRELHFTRGLSSVFELCGHSSSPTFLSLHLWRFPSGGVHLTLLLRSSYYMFQTILIACALFGTIACALFGTWYFFDVFSCTVHGWWSCLASIFCRFFLSICCGNLRASGNLSEWFAAIMINVEVLKLQEASWP